MDVNLAFANTPAHLVPVVQNSDILAVEEIFLTLRNGIPQAMEEEVIGNAITNADFGIKLTDVLIEALAVHMQGAADEPKVIVVKHCYLPP